MATVHPLLVLPAAVAGPLPKQPPKIGSGPRNPLKGRQIDRLGPKFDALQAVIDKQRALLQEAPAGVPLEQVLVFETNGPVKDLLEAVRKSPGLEWLSEEELSELAPDADFFDAEKADKKVSARLYMIMTNQDALEQLLGAWKAWIASLRGKKAPKGLQWRKVFLCLRDVRRWAVQDRIEETGILDQWREAIAIGASAMPVEFELWCRGNASARSKAEGQVRTLVESAGGRVLSTALIPEIAYHALLAELPRAEVERILAASQDVALVVADDLRLLRPTPQIFGPMVIGEPVEVAPETPPPEALRSPVVALLDGLPIENHAHLQGRLTVDDPDGFGATYGLAERRHGTAMASLILHGDLSSPGPTLATRLYVRPILRPRAEDRDRREMAPREQLWVDLVHQAVRRMFDGDGVNGPVAPDVRVVNFSVGDTFQPFLHSVSPIARLLDWLSWKYRLLFVVSAGNHPNAIGLELAVGESPSEVSVVKALHTDHRNRRLLAPAEAVNVLTVGAAHEDEAGAFQGAAADQQLLVVTEGMLSPISALGRGFRKAVKPDVLAPGGRVVFTRAPGQADGVIQFERAQGPKLPGQRVAAPGKTPGDLSAVELTTGTSNAAALTTRTAAIILETLEGLRATQGSEVLQTIPQALVAKALLVHTASWTQASHAVISAALRTKENASNFRDIASAFVGYGRIRPERATACTDQRATFVGGGFVRPNEQWLHTIPLPAALHAQRCWRRLTVTLAWFTPINPGRREYRGLVVRAVVPRSNVLVAKGAEVDGKAVSRGAVQHEVFEGDSRAMNIGVDEIITIPVNCFWDAGTLEPLPDEGVPYALAVSLEVAPETGLPIYEEVWARVRSAVRINS